MKNRAWTVLDGKGVFIYFETGEEGRFNWEIFDEDVHFDAFTGITDTKGNNVFVNDIITAELGGMGGGIIRKEIVVFRLGCYGIIPGGKFIPLYKLDGVEVTGHVYS